MQFGVTFFPDVTPDLKSARQYYAETCELVDFVADPWQRTAPSPVWRALDN